MKIQNYKNSSVYTNTQRLTRKTYMCVCVCSIPLSFLLCPVVSFYESLDNVYIQKIVILAIIDVFVFSLLDVNCFAFVSFI